MKKYLRGSGAVSEGVHMKRLTLSRKRNTLSTENGGNEERIDIEADNHGCRNGRKLGGLV